MTIILEEDAPKAEVEKLIRTFENRGLSVTMTQGDSYNVLGLVGDTSKINEKLMKVHPFAENITHTAAPYKKVNHLFHPAGIIVGAVSIKIGGSERIVVTDGPCPVEGDTQIMDTTKEMEDTRGDMLRGGVYKPGTSPHTFQDMGIEDVECMVHVRETYGLPIVSELVSADKVDELVGHVGLIQIGARNMQNFDLSKAVGRISEPVLLKYRLANTIEEWIIAAECTMPESNGDVVLCERDIRTFETYTRDTLDLSVVPIIKERTHLSIIADPSYTTGDWRLVKSASLAAITADADGLIIEIHNDLENV